MSTHSALSSSLPQAPWKPIFEKHLSSMETPQFVLSTLTPAPAGSPTPYLPRSRYVIYRGFWGTLPENKHNVVERNPRVYESEMPCITTDVRMQKTFELFSSSEGKATEEEQVQGSGGGGPVEAVWWVEGDVQTQWRLKGRAYVLCKDDIEGEGEESSGVRTVKSEVGRRMRIVPEGEGKEGVWSWSREIKGHFGNNSPGIRGSFKAPPPGQPVNMPYDDKKLVLGEKVTSNDDETALHHFRVIVIRPDEVEQTDLSDPKKARRYIYTIGEDGNWNKEETWP
ncbi:hypothetical protein EJ05DRAFT_229943 [Pseudovirgaria hyperparasitica]|uniref:Pyridoxamine 5'-phosphate oxidase Alr4036 family FMN-binding domain-containing protein n=1 Tax=Pseudovirgaria hyperparasitica TaxID=470096 RepID=A0A6A6VUQ9_9PEZI|nr:uncharacterized protein EJ05DRAFT_229943 [Pseudovirgaria hyperparasitica]KAF2752991.1 hypothetical protein EJ05DRAFT_229943 [Pseudovirgaria hyperparasitica]